MFSIVPKNKTGFRDVFRCLLVPLGAISVLFCGVAAILMAFGEGAVVINGHEFRGFAGALLCIAAVPFVTLFVTFTSTLAICFDRLRSRKRR